MKRIFGILQADTDAQRAEAKGAGCTHAIVNINWVSAQPTATGSVDATAIATLKSNLANCKSLSLGVILSINLHYPPSWVLSGVEQFKDQAGYSYNDTNMGAGKAVRNWMWTQTGRNYVADLITRIGAALTPDERAQVEGCRVGGGWYGELHYPQKITGSTAGTYAWQAFGASMQSGTDLATGLTVCPVPGYTPYSGDATKDAQFLDWYLNGITNWMTWLANTHITAGFDADMFVLLPGSGVRYNQSSVSGGSQNSGYKQAAALGEDHIRAMGEMIGTRMLPYSTYINWIDNYAPGGTVDSDRAAAKSVWEKAMERGLHYRLIGENTGNESNSGMDDIFAKPLGTPTYTGRPFVPDLPYYYLGLLWLSYSSLKAGGSNATMDHYASSIDSLT